MLQKQKSQTYIYGSGFVWRLIQTNCNPEAKLVGKMDAVVAKPYDKNISLPRS